MHVKLSFPAAIDVQITKGIIRLWQKNATLNYLVISVARWTSIIMLILIICASQGYLLTAQNREVAFKSAVISIVAAFIGRAVNEPIARLVSRPRPFEEMQFIPLTEHDRGDSYPSNHSTGAFALAIGCIHVPGYNVILLTLAVFLAISRVYCGLHYTSDVFMGTMHGIVIACLCLWIAF